MPGPKSRTSRQGAPESAREKVVAAVRSARASNSKSVLLTVIQRCGQVLQVFKHMQSADSFAAQRDYVVNMTPMLTSIIKSFDSLAISPLRDTP